MTARSLGRLTDEELTAMLARLAQAFQVDAPEWLRCDLDNEEAHYLDHYSVCRGVGGPGAAVFDPRAKTLAFGPLVHEGDVLHEFTHYLADLDGHKYGDNLSAHGRTFYARLVHVATAFYGDVKLYPWATDYPHVRAWAERDGHHSEAWWDEGVK